MPHYPEFVFVNLNDRVGGLHGVHHAFEREVMNIVFYAIVARVIVTINIGSYAGKLCEEANDSFVVPEIVDVCRVNGKMAEEDHSLLSLCC